MISDTQYDTAIRLRKKSQDIINHYCKERSERFEERMKNNPIFTDDELNYAALIRCPCGHGLAYPKGCGMQHYWDCSAILKGIADNSITHQVHLPFAIYEMKVESEHSGTTRGKVIPKGTAEAKSL